MTIKTLVPFQLPAGTALSLASTTHTLQLGLSPGTNIAFDTGTIQARNNGAAAPLRLSQYGGSASGTAAQVIIGGSDAISNLVNLDLQESTHATSRRAALKLGFNWTFMQDYAANGTRDLALYQTGSGLVPIRVTTDGQTVTLGGGNSAQYPLALTLADSTHATSRRAMVNVGTGWQIGQDLGGNGTKDFFLYNTGGSKNCIGISAAGDFLTLNCLTIGLSATQWFRSDSYQFTTANGSLFCAAFTNTTASLQGITTIQSGDLRLGTGATRLALYGTNGLYIDVNDLLVCRRTSDYATLWNCDTTGNFAIRARMTSADISITGGNSVYLYGTDANQRVYWYNGTPAGSGEAANGPVVHGWSSVWLYQASGNKSFYLASNGNAFLSAGCTYNVFSSIEFKDNVESLKPELCLDQVLRWRPVEFDFKDDELGYAPARRHGDGFIAEEMVKITPSVVNITTEESERPGWANAIDYAGLTPHLAGAIQALFGRIERLEEKAA